MAFQPLQLLRTQTVENHLLSFLLFLALPYSNKSPLPRLQSEMGVVVGGARSRGFDTMETANKSEAERCLGLAKKARNSGDVEKARRLAEKSIRLCSTQQAKGMSYVLFPQV